MKSLPNILITGTPGTGKSTLSSMIQEKVKEMKHIDVNALAKNDGLYEGFDNDRDVHIIDEDKICDRLEDLLADGGGIVDTHAMVDYFPERWFDLVLVLRTDNTVLYDRLIQRKYSMRKVQENVEAEIMQVLAEEARQSYEENIVHLLDNNTYEDLEMNLDRMKLWISEWKKDNLCKED